MPHRSLGSPRSTSALLQAVLIASMVMLAPSLAAGQRVGGSIGVSLTVLEPVATQAVQVTGFRMDRNGTATLETTAPTAGPTSQLVMARLAGSTGRYAPVRQTPATARGSASRNPSDRRMSYRVDVGRLASDAPRDVELRIEYLAVAGT